MLMTTIMMITRDRRRMAKICQPSSSCASSPTWDAPRITGKLEIEGGAPCSGFLGQRLVDLDLLVQLEHLLLDRAQA
jgi:hypothetical protein